MGSPRSKKMTIKTFSRLPGPQKPQRGSRFFTLPAELRNRIYALTLTDVVAYRARKTIPLRKIHRVKAKAPGLLLACKQSHEEAIRLFYAQTTFLFDDPKHIDVWSHKIGIERASLVTSLLLSSPMPQYTTMAASFWDPTTALWLYSMEASARLVQAKHGLPKALKTCTLKTDLYLPGSPEVDVVWTQQPVSVVDEFLEGADEKILGETHRAFLVLSNKRHTVW